LFLLLSSFDISSSSSAFPNLPSILFCPFLRLYLSYRHDPHNCAFRVWKRQYNKHNSYEKKRPRPEMMWSARKNKKSQWNVMCCVINSAWTSIRLTQLCIPEDSQLSIVSAVITLNLTQSLTLPVAFNNKSDKPQVKHWTDAIIYFTREYNWGATWKK
jgi:hypothetical protein